MPNAQSRVLAAAAQPQMAMIHQEVDPVVFGSDGVWIGFRHALDDFRVLHVQLEAAMSARLGANLTSHDKRRFLGQIFERFEERLRKCRLHRDALHDAGAVAELWEAN